MGLWKCIRCFISSWFYLQVSLENKHGIIQYDPCVVLPHVLVDEIEDMGFDAKVSDSGILKRTQTNIISIEGMTGNSCVKSIEQQVGMYTGVLSINVSSELSLACFSVLQRYH